MREEIALSLTGPMTRDEIPRWHEVLTENLIPNRALTLDLASSGPWDLAGLQIICAAIRTSESDGGAIRLCGAPADFLEASERSALMPRFSPYLSR